ncbi:MAG: DUF1013 domain-containing protein [Pseudomonadota bacterium]|nr:DUF1013 domain-containing protein [Pseudomonadota bacterium]
MAKPLMPQATAVWLVENTGLAFQQIAEFCNLHELEIQAIADEEVAVGMQGIDPIINGQLTRAEIVRCEADPANRLEMAETDIPQPVARPKGPRYTPLSRRQEKPDAIAWILRHHPELSDAQIGRLVGTTKPTINAIRDRTHRNMPNLRPRSPVELGLCSHDDLAQAIEKGLKAGRQPRVIEPLPEEPMDKSPGPFAET